MKLCVKAKREEEGGKDVREIGVGMGLFALLYSIV